MSRRSRSGSVFVGCGPLPTADSRAAFLLTILQGARRNYRQGQGKRFTPSTAGFEWFIQVCTPLDPDTFRCVSGGGPTQGSIRIRP